MTGAGEEKDDSVAPLPRDATAGFGRYQIFASLGRGGMADVFLAVARGPMGFNKLVVIKRLRPSLAQEEGFRDMFLDEARLAARLNHPNVIHTYEVGESQGSFFIAMEYLEGQPLNKVISESFKTGEDFDPIFCARIIADACSGLNHAHELRDYDGKPLQIIHRDVSPHNVFVTYDGQVKLVDFGIAKAALSSTETEVGVLKGKVAYMAPEQAMGGRIDARADIFAMGIVLWEFLARRRLMAGDNAANTLHRLMNEPIPALSTVMPSIDPRLEAIVMRALEKEPERRFASARDMRDALEGFIADSGQPMRQDEVGRRMAMTFAVTREKVQRQVQSYMAALSSPPTQSNPGGVRSMSLASIEQLEHAGGNASAQLLNLGDAASIASVPSDTHTSPSNAANAHALEGARRRRIIVGALLVALFGAVGIIALLVTSRRRPESITAAPIASSVALPSASPAASESAPPAPLASASATAQASSAPVASTVSTAAPSPPQAHAPRRAPPAGRSPPPRSPPAAAAANEGAPGFLTLDTYPWTRVSEAGRPLGSTPIVRASLSPGTHVLLLENPEQGIKQSYTVTIKSGEAVSRRLGLK